MEKRTEHEMETRGYIGVTFLPTPGLGSTFASKVVQNQLLESYPSRETSMGA